LLHARQGLAYAAAARLPYGRGVRDCARKERGRFLKNAAQKLLLFWARGAETARAQFKKSFLLLFFKKEAFSFIF
jgi:hypothetical protein